jgi:CRISPR-associated protein Cmr3
MKYLVTLAPLEPFLFGGDNTYGKVGDKENGTYLVKSKQFPQQSAILGMVKREIMTQAGILSRKVRGEWVDKHNKNKASDLVGTEKFDIQSQTFQDFGSIKSLGSLFLMSGNTSYIKKVAIDNYEFRDGLLINYTTKVNIYDSFVSLDNSQCKKTDDIFREVEQTGNKTGGEDNSLFKKTSYLLKDNFKFAFYLECEYKLKNTIVSLGADGSSFKLTIVKSNEDLNYEDKNGYLTLLSDSYITLPIKENCDFAITNEVSFRSLQNIKHSTQHNEFKKSKQVFLYEKGSVFINPSDAFIQNLNNENCQQIGYNNYSKGNN